MIANYMKKKKKIKPHRMKPTQISNDKTAENQLNSGTTSSEQKLPLFSSMCNI